MRKHLRSPGNGSSVSNTSLDSVSDVGHVVKITEPRHIPEKGRRKDGSDFVKRTCVPQLQSRHRQSFVRWPEGFLCNSSIAPAALETLGSARTREDYYLEHTLLLLGRNLL